MARSVVTLRDEQGVEYKVEVDVSGSVTTSGRTMHVLPARRGEVRVDERTVWVAVNGDERWIFIDGRVHILELVTAGVAIRTNTTASSPRARGTGHRDGALTAPMPATVAKISVSPGDQIKAGDVLIILEAMKMELPVRATVDGTVKAIHCREGELVQPGEELVELAGGDR
jgi:biotin carboxyl carrier protein